MPKRFKITIRVPGRRPKTIESSASEIPGQTETNPRKGKGKDLSRVLELAESPRQVSALDDVKLTPTPEDTAESAESSISAEQSSKEPTKSETNELCTMCASWKKALRSPGRLEWLAPAGPAECEHCWAKAVNFVELPREEEENEGRPELSVELPPSFIRHAEQVTSPLDGPEAMNEALLLEEARMANSSTSQPIISYAGAPERTPALSSTRSSISLGAADAELDDFDLGYPEFFDPSPPPSPHPHIADIEAAFMRCIEHYRGQAAAWDAAQAQAEINPELGYKMVEAENKNTSEKMVPWSNDLRMAMKRAPPAPGSSNPFGGLENLDPTGEDVNMADWLSSAAVTAPASVQVQG